MDLKLMTAYVDFEARGDVAPDVARQQQQTAAANRRAQQQAQSQQAQHNQRTHQQQQQANQRQQQQQQRHNQQQAQSQRKQQTQAAGGAGAPSRPGSSVGANAPAGPGGGQPNAPAAGGAGGGPPNRPGAAGGAGGMNLTNPQHGQALQYQRQQAQRQQQQQQQAAKLANESAERRRKGLEAAAERERRAAAEEARAADRLSNERKMKLLKAGALTKVAFGSVPFVGGAADIAMAGAAGGPVGAAAMAVGKGLQYGVEGAQKADPASFDRLKYQSDRLQAGFGSSLLPAVNKFTRGLENASNYLFGSGFQLSNPQMSSYSEMQDRLQTEALRKAPEINPDKPGPRAMRQMEEWGPILGVPAAIGSAISKDFSDSLDEFGKTIIGKGAKTIFNPLEAGRGLMDALGI